MKKLALFVICMIFIGSNLSAQWSGTGDGRSINTLYIGTVTGDLTWNPLDYPDNTIWIGNVTINPGVTLTIASGGQMRATTQTRRLTNNGSLNIEPGAGAWLYLITNNGLIRLISGESELTGPAQLWLPAGSNSGQVEIQRFLSGGSETYEGTDYYRWHYIASPIANTPVENFTRGNDEDPMTDNFAQYVEPLATENDNSTGWVAYDGYVYNPVGQNDSYKFTTLELGKGYNYYCPDDAVRVIAGSINTSNVSVELSCQEDNDYQGFNLVGNPFSTCIDWDLLIQRGWLAEGMSNAIYLTTNDQYASYVGGNPGVAQGFATGFIPPMQGFFVKTTVPGEEFYLPAESQAFKLNQMFYKGSARKSVAGSLPLIRLKFANTKDSTDLVVRFDQNATTDVDKLFDAYKLFKTKSKVSTWTKTGNVDYSINGLPFPETSVEIPVGIFTSVAGTYQLLSNELTNLDEYSVLLRDLTTKTTIDLKKKEIMEFNTPAGVVEDRFVLVVTKSSTGIQDIETSEREFSIYSSPGALKVISLTDKFEDVSGAVTIYDLTGRKIHQEINFEIPRKGEVREISSFNIPDGLYIVEIRAGSNKYAQKISIAF